MLGLLPELLRWIALDLCGMVLLVLGGLHLTTGSAPSAGVSAEHPAGCGCRRGRLHPGVALAAFKMLAILKSARAGRASGKAQNSSRPTQPRPML